jgi:hypothetical protein
MKTMRIFISISTVLFFCFLSYGQKAMTFNEANEQNIKMSSLDSQYQSGIHADTSLAVFKTNTDEYFAGYQDLLLDLGQYLKENNFLWDKPTNGFNRIYFDKNGKIDYFLYSFRPNQMTTEQEKRFAELLGKFILNYKFPLTANTKFSQCSPVTYMP